METYPQEFFIISAKYQIFSLLAFHFNSYLIRLNSLSVKHSKTGKVKFAGILKSKTQLITFNIMTEVKEHEKTGAL